MSAQSHIELVSNRALLSQVEKDSIATSISTLKTRLNSYYGANLSEQLQFGSSTRGTILPREMDSRSDIDYLIVFCDEEAKPQTYINRLKRFAEKYYTSSQITQSHPTIVLSLNHIKFDLVAARVGFFSEYKIPAPSSTYSEWTTTSPKEFNTQLSDKNKDRNFLKNKDILILLDGMHMMGEYYSGDHDPSNPILSPVFADIKSFPDVLIQVCSNELLYNDAVEFSKKLELINSKHELQVWDDLWHAWQFFPIKEAEEAREKITKFINTESYSSSK